MVDLSSGPVVLVHEGGFEGFLTAVFEVMRLRLEVERVEAASRHVPGLLDTVREIEADEEKARRVMTGIVKQGGKDIAGMVQAAFLSEVPGIGTVLWRYLHGLFRGTDGSRGRNLLDADAHAVFQAAQKTRYEAHLFQGFVRFRRAPDGSMFAVIAPEHDILAMLAPHFAARFPSHSWMIADSRRGQCLRYDGTQVQRFACDPAHLPKDDAGAAALAEEGDERFDGLWRAYFEAVNIEARRNPRLQARLLPRKYWKYLPERSGIHRTRKEENA
jgi:probable DNA metabolism protein